MSEQRYQLPDILRDWPWTRRLSPYYLDAGAESNVWIASFRPFDSRGQDVYDACDFALFGSLTYNRDRDLIRAGCDLVHFFFIYDEYTDVADASVARALASSAIFAMKNPEIKPDNPHIVVEMLLQLSKRISRLAAPGAPCFEHFVATTESYLNAVPEEIEDRTYNNYRHLEDYMRLRREAGAVRPALALVACGLDLPNVVSQHQILVSLTRDAGDLILLVNDVHSYMREVSCDAREHNAITAIMVEHRLNFQDALIWLGSYTDAIVSRFLSDSKRIPSWGPDIDKRVQMYVDGIGQWVRGNDDWCHETTRYHGDEGLKVQEDRILKGYQRPGNYLRSDFEVGVGGELDVELEI